MRFFRALLLAGFLPVAAEQRFKPVPETGLRRLLALRRRRGWLDLADRGLLGDRISLSGLESGPVPDPIGEVFDRIGPVTVWLEVAEARLPSAMFWRPLRAAWTIWSRVRERRSMKWSQKKTVPS